jgi:hypothetical protein
MNEEKNPEKPPIEVEEFKEFSRQRPEDPPGEGSGFLRGCGIAVGIAALVFLFVVGACFVSLSQW